MQCNGHIAKLTRREAEAVGLPRFLELPQDGVMTTCQDRYDWLHGERRRIGTDKITSLEQAAALYPTLFKIDCMIGRIEEVSRRLGAMGIKSGLITGDPAKRGERPPLF